MGVTRPNASLPLGDRFHLPEGDPTRLLSDVDGSDLCLRDQIDDVHFAGLGTHALDADERITRIGTERYAMSDGGGALKLGDAGSGREVEQLDSTALFERSDQVLAIRGRSEVVWSATGLEPTR